MSEHKDYTPDLLSINAITKSHGVFVNEIYANTKASDYFIAAIFIQDDGFRWDSVVPYIYRRSGLNLQSDQEVAEYLITLKPYFTEEAMNAWREREWSKWMQSIQNVKNPEKLVTINFFERLLSFKTETEMPPNSNPQRRLQEIKDQGYTVSIYPMGNRVWGKVLLPIPLNTEMGYEIFTPQFKKRVIRLFNGINAYESKKTPEKSLIPDHKFSEVRWDENTKSTNPMEMSDEEIIAKFQLLDNQRNQQKREVCRACAQSGIRGSIFGIDFYPEGARTWDPSIPQKGKLAERGCIGCPWYDIEAWRRAVNKILKDK